MGMIAENMAEAVERSRSDPAGAMLDLRAAANVEVMTGADGLVWVNVDGVMALRIRHVDAVVTDTTQALSESKVV